MIFLIEFDRAKERLITFSKFADADREDAEDRRLKIELELHRQGIDHEVVLLEAVNEDLLRRTHRRYFEGVSSMLESAAAAALRG